MNSWLYAHMCMYACLHACTCAYVCVCLCINGLVSKAWLTLHQVDVTTAFLNGTLDDEVYMQQPKGFECQGKEEFVCRLNKSIYRLKQSPHCWNSTLNAYLKKIQFTQTASNPCIYYQKTEQDMMFTGI